MAHLFRYVILNVQRTVDKDTNALAYVYREVGTFSNQDQLKLNMDKIVFPDGKRMVTSVCSDDCQFGFVKQTKQDGHKCCWTCKKCDNYSYVLDEFTCQECPLGYWPNDNLNGNKLIISIIKYLTLIIWNIVINELIIISIPMPKKPQYPKYFGYLNIFFNILAFFCISKIKIICLLKHIFLNK